jgi:pimeloyl-ACP methyl ester carboxylesterase
MQLNDAGLAHDLWKKFYTPEEVEEITQSTTTTTVISGIHPLHVRLYLQPRPAPTVLMAGPMLTYGILLARTQLPFFRAGFNVVQWDLPGWGQSGGARWNCPIGDIIQGWHDILAFAEQHFAPPFYGMGFGEDSITMYYAGANNPLFRALTLHTLCEFGDPEGVSWQGPPWLVRIKGVGARVAAKLVPDMGVEMHRAMPWTTIFSGPDDKELMEVFEGDPLRPRKIGFRLAASTMTKRPFPVQPEECRTPIQFIMSEHSTLWRMPMNMRYYNRLSGTKELVVLKDSEQWVYTREWQEALTGHVIAWFIRNGALEASAVG